MQVQLQDRPVGKEDRMDGRGKKRKCTLDQRLLRASLVRTKAPHPKCRHHRAARYSDELLPGEVLWSERCPPPPNA